MASLGGSELLEAVVNQLIDEEALGVCFEMHRAIKLGYYELLYPDDSMFEKHDVIDSEGLDIFGNTPQSLQKNIDCQCPNCDRTLGSQKFAPHLEKCMGMGRNSSRIASRKNNQTPVESDQEGAGSEEEEEWIYPERRGSKKIKKEKMMMTSSPHKGGTSTRPGPGRPLKSSSSTLNLKPSLQQHNVASFTTLPSDYKHTLLEQICGVVSGRTGRLCTRSVNCPQHSEDQRLDIRRKLLPEVYMDVPLSHPKRRERADTPEEVEPESAYEVDTSLASSSSLASLTSASSAVWRRRRNRAGKKTKRSGNHGNSTMVTGHFPGSSSSMF